MMASSLTIIFCLFQNPERFSNPGKLSLAVQLSEDCERVQNKDAWELADLLRKPHLKVCNGKIDSDQIILTCY